MQNHFLRRLLPPLCALLLLPSCFGCRGKSAPLDDLSTEQIIERLYGNAPGIELPALASTPITAENMTYYAGVDTLPVSEGTASEPLINAIPFSVCVFRLTNARDSSDVQTLLRENANPHKWICVNVEEQNVVVDGAGDVVILIMADESAALHEAFQKIAGRR